MIEFLTWCDDHASILQWPIFLVVWFSLRGLFRKLGWIK